jgi:hypothetical protein
MAIIKAGASHTESGDIQLFNSIWMAPSLMDM